MNKISLDKKIVLVGERWRAETIAALNDEQTGAFRHSS
jgi:hypothetical protein